MRRKRVVDPSTGGRAGNLSGASRYQSFALRRLLSEFSRRARREVAMGSLLYIIGAVVVAMWLIGLLSNVGGSMIHLLLVIAAVIFVAQFVTGRRSV